MATPVSAERARLARDIARAERELDKTMNLLGKTQKALVDVGTSITGMHQSLLEMKKALGQSGADEPPANGGRPGKAG